MATSTTISLGEGGGYFNGGEDESAKKEDFLVGSLVCNKRFFHDIKFWANNQYNADQIFLKLALWSGP